MENFEHQHSAEGLQTLVIELQDRMHKLGKFDTDDTREILEEAVLLFQDRVDANNNPIDIEAVVNEYIEKMIWTSDQADKRAE